MVIPRTQTLFFCSSLSLVLMLGHKIELSPFQTQHHHTTVSSRKEDKSLSPHKALLPKKKNFPQSPTSGIPLCLIGQNESHGHPKLQGDQKARIWKGGTRQAGCIPSGDGSLTTSNKCLPWSISRRQALTFLICAVRYLEPKSELLSEPIGQNQLHGVVQLQGG